jgi:hypothetical protein
MIVLNFCYPPCNIDIHKDSGRQSEIGPTEHQLVLWNTFCTEMDNILCALQRSINGNNIEYKIHNTTEKQEIGWNTNVQLTFTKHQDKNPVTDMLLWLCFHEHQSVISATLKYINPIHSFQVPGSRKDVFPEQPLTCLGMVLLNMGFHNTC